MSTSLVPAWCFFFFNDTATTEIYTLSLHDALPIWADGDLDDAPGRSFEPAVQILGREDRKSTRLNSSHDQISYAVFRLKKEKIYDPGNKLSDSTRLRLALLTEINKL